MNFKSSSISKSEQYEILVPVVDLQLKGKIGRLLALGIIIGIFALIAGFSISPQRTWANILLNNYYFLSLAAGGAVWTAIHYVANAGWGVLIRRVPEAMTAFLPISLITMLLLFFGMNSLYEWTHASVVSENPVLQWKQPYLNIPFFFIRMVIFILTWILLARAITKNSLNQDKIGSTELTKKNVKLSVIFLLTFAVTFIFASFDWIMSLEPEWYSTIFGFYNISGLLLNGIAATTIIVILLKRSGMLPNINQNHLNDLGRLVFAMSIFWAYLWFSQIMLIWYSNISEEVTYFIKRQENGWYFSLYLTVFVKWLIPFLGLISRKAKRNEKRLLIFCIIVMAGHWLDLYTMILPVFEVSPVFSFYEVGTFIGFLSLFAYIVIRRLKQISLIPTGDPYLYESLHLHN